MTQLLPDPLPWFVAGPLIGLLIVALYALANQRLGASSAYAQVIHVLSRRPGTETWKAWYFGGMLVGALIAVVLRGGPVVGIGYGALGRVVPLAALIPLLFLGGLLLGYGARWAGGCTSGHGLSGASSRSPGSIATLTAFMITGIAITILLHILTGGLL